LQYFIFEKSNIVDYLSRIDAVSLVLESYDEELNKWTAEEVGDGNVNLVFIVKSKYCSIIVKQVLRRAITLRDC
jgi:5-methylthioribose kinase